MPSEGVFLVRDGELIEMQHSLYAAEADLQELLADYPGLLSGRQVNPASPREWLLIAREKGVPGALDGPDQWSVDNLFVDQDGIPTIVEVKRSTDTRIRREVVGQMLDYAANGVRYWPVERLRDDLAARVGGAEAADRAVSEFLAAADVLEVAPDQFWRQVDGNLRAGRLRMLFVADAIPAQLQRIIEFLNEQMTQCEVLGIEIRQYVAEGHRVFAPTVIGQTSESRRLKGQGDTRTFEELLADASDVVRETESRLSALAEREDWSITTSRAARQYRLPDGTALFGLYPRDDSGSVEFEMGRIHDAAILNTGLKERAEALQAELSRLAGRPLTRVYPRATVESLRLVWSEFEERWLPDYVAAHIEVSGLRRRAADSGDGGTVSS
jgi:hypothetical protein